MTSQEEHKQQRQLPLRLLTYVVKNKMGRLLASSTVPVSNLWLLGMCDPSVPDEDLHALLVLLEQLHPELHFSEQNWNMTNEISYQDRVTVLTTFFKYAAKFCRQDYARLFNNVDVVIKKCLKSLSGTETDSYYHFFYQVLASLIESCSDLIYKQVPRGYACDATNLTSLTTLL